VLKVSNLNKSFSDFKLKNVSFEIPQGAIVGFIGQNGAGKTTTLKCILRSIVPDSGDITLYGKNIANNETECKQQLSYTCGAFEYYRKSKLNKIASVYSKFYNNWNAENFESYAKKFNLNLEKRVKELSAGMKVKFALALAMSHDAKLFIFDEPTSGLDPIARDELLDIFLDIVNEGDKSILFSTHITSDLDKCADYVMFIRNGEIIVNEAKDELFERHVLVKGGGAVPEEYRKKAVAFKQNTFGYAALLDRKNYELKKGTVTEKPTLEDIMVFYDKSTNN